MKHTHIFAFAIAGALALSSSAFAQDHQETTPIIKDHKADSKLEKKVEANTVYDNLHDHGIGVGFGPSFGRGGTSGKLTLDYKNVEGFYYIGRSVGATFSPKLTLGKHVKFIPGLGLAVNPGGGKGEAMSAADVRRKLDVVAGGQLDVSLWKGFSIRPGVQWFLPTRVGDGDRITGGTQRDAFRNPRAEVLGHWSF